LNLRRIAKGVAQPVIAGSEVKKIVITIPNKEEQSHIIAELELLSEIITAKRAQIDDLDALAQSVFYEMFGDPVSNEKMWLTAQLKDIAPQRVFKGPIPKKHGKTWLLNLDMVEAQTGDILEKKYFTDEEIGNSTTTFNEDNVLYSKLRPYLNKVVLPDEPGYCTTELVPLAPVPNTLDRFFFAYLLRSKFFVDYISGRVAGAKMPRVSMGDFRAFDVITPPIQMQREFADKVMDIQDNKRRIKETLKDVETLLASRLDYYFNE
jgi:type I restriction enzyme S subunit